MIRAGGTQVKVEVTPVLRGVVFDPIVRAVSPGVEEAFGFAETTLVSVADLYAGKRVAALDRQHSRDLFDVRNLLANEGLTRPLMDACLVYLVSHNRQMAEVLSSTRKDLREEFARTFDGMTDAPVDLEQLFAAREALIAGIPAGLTAADRTFLLGVKTGRPDWSLVGLPQAGAAGGAVASDQLGAPDRGPASGAGRSAQEGSLGMKTQRFSNLPIGKFSRTGALPSPAWSVGHE